MSTPGPTKRVSDDEIIDCLQNMKAPFATGKDVASQINLSAEQCRNRLDDLEKKGLVASKRAGSARGWWVP